MNGSEIFVGVDGGATKTLAVAAKRDGLIIGVGEAGPSNYHLVGLEGAVTNINTAIKEAIKGANIDKADVVTLGLAGMDTKRDFVVFEREAAPKVAGKIVYVRHDAEIALVGATLGSPGVIVIAGTGSVAGARNRKGEYSRCGGWGHLVGDEGSAYFIAKEALRAILWAYDGRGAPTALTEEILRALSIESPEDIISKVYVERMSVRDLARLAPLVTEAARRGDSVALQIVEESARQLALHVVSLVKKLKMMEEQPIKVALVGGVFRAGNVIVDPFRRFLEKHFAVEIVKPELPPAVGALLLSYILHGEELSGSLLNNIKNSLQDFSSRV